MLINIELSKISSWLYINKLNLNVKNAMLDLYYT